MSPSSTRTSRGGRSARRAFPARTSSLVEIREFVRERVPAAGLSEDAVGDLVLAVSEAAANAVVHSGTTEPLDVRITSGRNGVEVQVSDRGLFRSRVRTPGYESTGGNGIPLMVALVDELSITEGTERRPGTIVRLRKLRA